MTVSGQYDAKLPLRELATLLRDLQLFKKNLDDYEVFWGCWCLRYHLHFAPGLVSLEN
jgi:hypothetical protein